jgi:hypothetical protein
MSKFTKLDTMLISEAYSAQLLLESAPYMTIAEIQSKLPTMTIAEAQIIEEMFGKMGRAIGQVASGIGNVAGAAGRGLKSAGQAVGKAIGNAGQTAKQVGSGIASAAGQVGTNVKNMYQTGADSKEAEQAVAQAQQAIEDLINLIDTAKAKYGEGSTFGMYFSENPMNMTLTTISNQLNMASQTAQGASDAANKKGFTGGVGSAFKQGFQGQGQQGAPPQGAAPTAPVGP